MCFSLTYLSLILDIPYPMFCTHFAVNHSCVTVIEFENKKTLQPRILSFSNDSYLYREGLPQSLIIIYISNKEGDINAKNLDRCFIF